MGLAENFADKVSDYYARMRGTVGPDYDYSKASPMQTFANGHSVDAGKLPNHPTFSTESAYHSAATPGGVWGYDANGKVVSYTPSADMVQRGATKGLAEYMRLVEPGVELLAPAPYATLK